MPILAPAAVLPRACGFLLKPALARCCGAENAKYRSGLACFVLRRTGENAVLWTIVVILLALWLTALVTHYTLAGFVHILLIVAIVIALIQILGGRRAV